MHRINRRLAASGLALALLGTACQKDEEFAGTYVGDAIDSQDSSNRKEFTLNVTAAGTTVSGSYRIKAILLDTVGVVNGTLNGSALMLTLTPNANDCPYRING